MFFCNEQNHPVHLALSIVNEFVCLLGTNVKRSEIDFEIVTNFMPVNFSFLCHQLLAAQSYGGVKQRYEQIIFDCCFFVLKATAV